MFRLVFWVFLSCVGCCAIDFLGLRGGFVCGLSFASVGARFW